MCCSFHAVPSALRWPDVLCFLGFLWSTAIPPLPPSCVKDVSDFDQSAVNPPVSRVTSNSSGYKLGLRSLSHAPLLFLCEETFGSCFCSSRGFPLVICQNQRRCYVIWNDSRIVFIGSWIIRADTFFSGLEVHNHISFFSLFFFNRNLLYCRMV